MSVDREGVKAAAVVVALAAAVFLGGWFVVSGPAGMSRQFQNWTANWGGSDWLVVQYNQSGGVISSWELHGKSVESESGCDGIYFTDNDGNIVHLSGHYVFVQIVGGEWKAARTKLLPAPSLVLPDPTQSLLGDSK